MQQDWQANQANEEYSDSYEGESGASDGGRSEDEFDGTKDERRRKHRERNEEKLPPLLARVNGQLEVCQIKRICLYKKDLGGEINKKSLKCIFTKIFKYFLSAQKSRILFKKLFFITGSRLQPTSTPCILQRGYALGYASTRRLSIPVAGSRP